MRLAALLLLAGASGCAERDSTVIDGSSEAAFERSVAEARREIPDADRLVFDRALRTVGGRRFAVRDEQALARLSFNGMTGREVVEDQRAREQQGSVR